MVQSFCGGVSRKHSGRFLNREIGSTNFASSPELRRDWSENALHFPCVKMPSVETRGASQSRNHKLPTVLTYQNIVFSYRFLYTYR